MSGFEFVRHELVKYAMNNENIEAAYEFYKARFSSDLYVLASHYGVDYLQTYHGANTLHLQYVSTFRFNCKKG